MITASHDLRLTYQADRILLLGENGILAEGSPAELYRRCEIWDLAGLKLPGWANPDHLERW